MVNILPVHLNGDVQHGYLIYGHLNWKEVKEQSIWCAKINNINTTLGKIANNHRHVRTYGTYTWDDNSIPGTQTTWEYCIHTEKEILCILAMNPPRRILQPEATYNLKTYWNTTNNRYRCKYRYTINRLLFDMLTGR